MSHDHGNLIVVLNKNMKGNAIYSRFSCKIFDMFDVNKGKRRHEIDTNRHETRISQIRSN